MNADRGRVYLRPISVARLAWFVAACLLVAATAASKDKTPALRGDFGTWRGADDVIEGWDFSLPPGLRPVPRSGLSFRGQAPEGFAGRRLTNLNWSWRRLEPTEGTYDFDSLRKAIRDTAAKYDGILFHLRASTYEVKYRSGRIGKGAAPLWLVRKYKVPLVEEKVKDNIATPFTVVNLKLDDANYHGRYLKMVQALGASDIPKMKEITFAFVHGTSGSRGEEWGGVQARGGQLDACFKQRLTAWAKAFKGGEHKLTWVGHRGDLLKHAYDLGMGQRCGFVEMYLYHADNPQLGQSVGDDGYLVVDETCPPIAENRSFGDENEEYRVSTHIPRFGPVKAWPHRYRESMLRALQMRRNWLWAESDPWVNHALLNYVGLELGRTIEDAPDAWCYLRESYIAKRVGRRRQVVGVKNFERWLYQRDAKGFRTVPVFRVDHPISRVAGGGVPKEFQCDFTARRTDRASGSDRIGLALDDRFLSGGPHKVAVKITYRDVGTGQWDLLYRTRTGRTARSVRLKGSGKVKTATFFLADAHFRGRKLGFDFEIVARGRDATISFVRVIKLPAKR